MSAWVHWSFVASKPRPKERDRRFYGRIAPHIRGRVYQIHPAHGRRGALWGMQVINTATGKVIASDNCIVLQDVIDECDEVTAVARAAWFWSFSPKKVRP